MTTPQGALDAAERARRIEFIRDAKVAFLNDETIQQRTRKFEGKASDWALWLRRRMDDTGCATPAEILPDVCARLEQIAEDRANAAVREIKRALKDALK
jgi:hypothetical protein